MPDPAWLGLTLHMNLFDAVHEQEDSFIWVDANASWAALLAATLKESRVPFVTPYNLNLSIAGLISVVLRNHGAFGANFRKAAGGLLHGAEPGGVFFRYDSQSRSAPRAGAGLS